MICILNNLQIHFLCSNYNAGSVGVIIIRVDEGTYNFGICEYMTLKNLSFILLCFVCNIWDSVIVRILAITLP